MNNNTPLTYMFVAIVAGALLISLMGCEKDTETREVYIEKEALSSEERRKEELQKGAISDKSLSDEQLQKILENQIREANLKVKAQLTASVKDALGEKGRRLKNGWDHQSNVYQESCSNVELILAGQIAASDVPEAVALAVRSNPFDWQKHLAESIREEYRGFIVFPQSFQVERSIVEVSFSAQCYTQDGKTNHILQRWPHFTKPPKMYFSLATVKGYQLTSASNIDVNDSVFDHLEGKRPNVEVQLIEFFGFDRETVVLSERDNIQGLAKSHLIGPLTLTSGGLFNPIFNKVLSITTTDLVDFETNGDSR